MGRFDNAVSAYDGNMGNAVGVARMMRSAVSDFDDAGAKEDPAVQLLALRIYDLMGIARIESGPNACDKNDLKYQQGVDALPEDLLGLVNTFIEAVSNVPQSDSGVPTYIAVRSDPHMRAIAFRITRLCNVAPVAESPSARLNLARLCRDLADEPEPDYASPFTFQGAPA